MILLLEDDAARVRRFNTVAREVCQGKRLVAWSDAHEMVRECSELLPEATLISLDHDLIAPRADVDSGDGVVVAEFLCSQPVVRPVIVHTSNVDRGTRMMGLFELAGWPHWRVPAVGEDWIESDWRTVVRVILAGTW